MRMTVGEPECDTEDSFLTAHDAGGPHFATARTHEAVSLSWLDWVASTGTAPRQVLWKSTCSLGLCTNVWGQVVWSSAPSPGEFPLSLDAWVSISKSCSQLSCRCDVYLLYNQIPEVEHIALGQQRERCAKREDPTRLPASGKTHPPPPSSPAGESPIDHGSICNLTNLPGQPLRRPGNDTDTDPSDTEPTQETPRCPLPRHPPPGLGRVAARPQHRPGHAPDADVRAQEGLEGYHRRR
jgi:hypothetical protein